MIAVEVESWMCPGVLLCVGDRDRGVVDIQGIYGFRSKERPSVLNKE